MTALPSQLFERSLSGNAPIAVVRTGRILCLKRALIIAAQAHFSDACKRTLARQSNLAHLWQTNVLACVLRHPCIVCAASQKEGGAMILDLLIPISYSVPESQ